MPAVGVMGVDRGPSAGLPERVQTKPELALGRIIPRPAAQSVLPGSSRQSGLPRPACRFVFLGLRALARPAQEGKGGVAYRPD